MIPGRPVAFLLIAIALVAGFGHCVLPVPVHAGGDEPHHSTAPAHGGNASHGHHSPDAGAVHVAPCDAVAAPVAPPPTKPSVRIVARADIPIAGERSGSTVGAEVRPTGTSPPLFLLHATLLI
jgi:hypothetical protein